MDDGYKNYFLILEQLNLHTSVEINKIKIEGLNIEGILDAIRYLTQKKFITVHKSQIWLSKKGYEFLGEFVKDGNGFHIPVNVPEGFKYQSLSDFTLDYSQRLLDLNKPDLTKKLKQNNIPPTKKRSIAKRIKNISLAEWGIIWTIIAGIIALWVYVIKPITDSW